MPDIVKRISLKNNQGDYTNYDIGANANNVSLVEPINIGGNIYNDAESALNALNNNNSDVVIKDFISKTQTGLTSFDGKYVWTDGNDIYYSNNYQQYKLNKNIGEQTEVTWGGLASNIRLDGQYIWSDGEDTYYSRSLTGHQYKLNKTSGDQETATQQGKPLFDGINVQKDGNQYYLSYNSDQYVLDKTTTPYTWVVVTWFIPEGTFGGNGYLTQSDGTNTYYSSDNTQYVLDKTNPYTQTQMTQTGLTSFIGSNVWTSNEGDIYLSEGTKQYVLNKETHTWSPVSWSIQLADQTNFKGEHIQTDESNVYFSYGSEHFIFGNRKITEAGVPNGLATLDSNGKLNNIQIPSGAMVKGIDYVTAGQKANTTLGNGATAEGQNTTAEGPLAHAEGQSTVARGINAHAEGKGTTASNANTHAEGLSTIASDANAHAEGNATTASNANTHAEGYLTVASGPNAHAEGNGTTAAHTNAHAEGFKTVTGNANQHVGGRWNVGKNNTLFEVGNGTASNAKSNAFEVYEDGNVTAAGDITDGEGNVLANMLGISKVGIAGGVAGLGNDGKVPINQLPVGWTSLGYLSDTLTTLNIPSDAKELLIRVQSNTTESFVVTIIPTNILSSATNDYNLASWAYLYTTPEQGRVDAYITSTYIQMHRLYDSANEPITVYIWYR